jgi:hypothetical protein
VPLGLIKAMTKAEGKRQLRSILEKRGINAPDYLERVNQDVRTFAKEAKWRSEKEDKMNSHR